ncbi:MAG: hypothetical protein U0990_11605 [Candidatus Nanopelagicales bacterium]|nr:hypothetical protein [Candidatus Nanopelagicales bacterium]MDZ4250712.1 hypothetical protein [Candidatus Nanopelagicales bacterium]MDZ7576900.1 hypothetical protein [Candidatus Nanopelagicales bacterium]
MKRLVDIDDKALEQAKLALGAKTIKETVNASLELAGRSRGRAAQIARSMEIAKALDLDEATRAEAWR